MESQKMLPIGIENFEKIRKESFYYIDKTNLIKELLHNWGEVNLFTRPRRFGKSLNMSMLKSFFELGGDSSLFAGLNISKEKELCERYMGQFPVISLSLKGVDGNNYAAARAMLCSAFGKEALRFQFLLESDNLTEDEKKLYRQLISIDEGLTSTFVMSDSTLTESILILSQLLQKHYKRKVIILIDEYDVPLDKAYQHGYYDQMSTTIRNIFNQALKSNESMQFAVMTGCLRISKESIFTGLNNPNVASITTVQFDEYFGFTDEEVQELIAYYKLEEHYETIRKWYNGYQFGRTSVYCPWDVINYCYALRFDNTSRPQNYWSNTSSNNIIKMFLKKAKSATKREIEALIAGESVKKQIQQELTYKDLESNIDNLWSMLFTTGYLTQRNNCAQEKIELVIPNEEIRNIFITQISEWFDELAVKDQGQLNNFCYAFKNGDTQMIEDLFNAYLMKTISIRDTNARKEKKENFYHGILLGLLGHMEDWSILSNAETGEGYSDIMVEIEDAGIGIIIEIKYAENNALESACAKALKQIEAKHYEQVLVESGMKIIIKYGIACYRKHCKVTMLPIKNM